MKIEKYRKLNIYLPPEPTTDERPWSIAGVLFALALLLFIAYAYLSYKRIF